MEEEREWRRRRRRRKGFSVVVIGRFFQLEMRLLRALSLFRFSFKPPLFYREKGASTHRGLVWLAGIFTSEFEAFDSFAVFLFAGWTVSKFFVIE